MFLSMTFAAALVVSGETSCDSNRSNIARQNAETAWKKGQLGEAGESFVEAFKDCPTDHSLLLRISEAKARTHRGPEAIAAAKQFVALEPSSIDGRLMLANAYFMAERPVEALGVAESVLVFRPNDAAAMKIKGNAEYLCGTPDKAMQTFLALLDAHPQDFEAAYMLGRVYYQEGRVEQAIGQFERVLKLHPESYKAMDNLGLCYQSLGNPEMAKRYFLTAIKMAEEQRASYDWAYANLANLLLEKEDAGQAFAAASKAVERNPLSARNFYLGGKALQQLGKEDLSITWLERSASLDSKYPEPLYLLARLYREKGENAKAAATLEKFRIVKAATPRERK